MELKLCQARYFNRTDDMPPEMKQRIDQLERQLMTIDSLFAVLSENEEFVVRCHILAELDWPQVLSEYVKKWGVDAEKSIRSLQICQSKALEKISRTVNARIDFPLLNE